MVNGNNAKTVMCMLPSMNQLAIDLKSVGDLDALKSLINLFHLTIVAQEPGYLIVDGDLSDINDFKKFWNEG